MGYLIYIFLASFSTHIAATNMQDLPWIDAVDSETINYVEPFLPINPVILEAGVNKAEDTIHMKEKWPESTIYGFEAHPESFAKAREQVKTLKSITLYNYALFNIVSKASFYLSPKMPATSSLLQDNLNNIEFPKDFYHFNYGDTPIQVDCITIDHWAEQCGIKKIDYMWLDAEGSELYILQCAQTVLPTVKVISIEVNSNVINHVLWAWS
jgi:FkbM family methyltransferase